MVCCENCGEVSNNELMIHNCTCQSVKIHWLMEQIEEIKHIHKQQMYSIEKYYEQIITKM